MATRKATMVGDEADIKNNDQPPVEEAPPVTEQDEEATTEEAGEETEEEEEWDSRAMDPDQELYPGGPTFAQINAWKDQHGEVFVTDFAGKYYVWRTMSRFEYRNIMRKLEQAVSSGQVSQGEAQMNNEDDIAELCILHPPYRRTEAAGHLAGVAATISQQVMEASAFVASDVRQL